jgi:hypothetical protein
MEGFNGDAIFEGLKAKLLKLRADVEDVYSRMEDDEKRKNIRWLREEFLRRGREKISTEEADASLIDESVKLVEPLLVQALEEVFEVTLDEQEAV